MNTEKMKVTDLYSAEIIGRLDAIGKERLRILIRDNGLSWFTSPNEYAYNMAIHFLDQDEPEKNNMLKHMNHDDGIRMIVVAHGMAIISEHARTLCDRLCARDMTSKNNAAASTYRDVILIGFTLRGVLEKRLARYMRQAET